MVMMFGEAMPRETISHKRLVVFESDVWCLEVYAVKTPEDGVVDIGHLRSEQRQLIGLDSRQFDAGLKIQAREVPSRS